MSEFEESPDLATARAFASSWAHCFASTPYTREQYLDWISPIEPDDLAGRRVLELGCGNGGLLQFTAEYARGGEVVGIDLGESADIARRNLAEAGFRNAKILREDLLRFAADHPEAFDVVYCIGVLHHMESPRSGFRAVVDSTRPGGRFHCWVYGREGTGLLRLFVEPLRTVTHRLPWWLNKYVVALPLAVPFFILSKSLRALGDCAEHFPMGEYFRHIGVRGFAFHHHVVFDQLVTPRTTFIARGEIESWLADESGRVTDTYILPRNGNSWKFGGSRR